MRSVTMLLWALLVLMFVPGVAGAQTIFKCAVKGKAVSYQSEPCPENAKIESIREFQTYSAPAPVHHRTVQTTTTTTGHQTRNATGAQIHNIALGSGNRCADAKRDRDAWERAVGLSRSIDGIRAWNELVYDACK